MPAGVQFRTDFDASNRRLFAKRCSDTRQTRIYRRGVAPDITYDFKHALVQDAAYHTKVH